MKKNMDLKTPLSTQTKTETHIVFGVVAGLISTFAFGLAFIGIIQVGLKEEPIEEIIENPVVVQEAAPAKIILDNSDLTVFQLSENTKESFDELKSVVLDQGGHVYLNMDGNVFAKVDDVQTTLNTITSPATTLTYTQLQEKSAIEKSQTQTNIETLLYREALPNDVDTRDLGDDAVTDEDLQQLVVGDDAMPTSEVSTDWGEAPSIPADVGLKGNVYVEFLYIESPGGRTDWATSEVQETYVNNVNGLLLLARSAPPEMNLTFITRLFDHTYPKNQVSYDPAITDQYYWQFELMQNRDVCMNYDEATATCLDVRQQSWDIVDVYTEGLVQSTGYPQAFIAIVVKDTGQSSDAYPHAAFRHSLIVLNWTYGYNISGNSRNAIADMTTAAHETMHIFYAHDQYLASGGCAINSTAPESIRVYAAGGQVGYENKNNIDCAPYYPSLMSGGVQLGSYTAPSPPLYLVGGLPPYFTIDWYSGAQVNWGDQPEGVRVKINRQRHIEGVVWKPDTTGPIDIYVDGSYFATYDMLQSSWEDYLFIPLPEGTYSVDVKNNWGIETTDGPKTFTVTNTAGQEGLAIVELSLNCTTGNCLACEDRTAGGACNDQLEYCSSTNLTPSDCRQCGCAVTEMGCIEQDDGAYACQFPEDYCDRNPDLENCPRTKIE